MTRIYMTGVRDGKTRGSIIIGKPHLLKIGELAKTTSESPSTLRFWTQQKLIEAVGVTKGGYRLYESSMIKRVVEIRRLQQEKRLTIVELRTYFKTISTNRSSKTIFRFQ